MAARGYGITQQDMVRTCLPDLQRTFTASAGKESSRTHIVGLLAGRIKTCFRVSAKCEAPKEGGSACSGWLHLARFLAAGAQHQQLTV